MKRMNLNQVVRNIDRRLERVEQILPTLPTRPELDRKLDERLAMLATKGELQEAFERSHTRTLVLFEDLKGDIRLRADGMVNLQASLDRRAYPRRSPN